jgi:hypothetical protein
MDHPTATCKELLSKTLNLALESMISMLTAVQLENVEPSAEWAVKR